MSNDYHEIQRLLHLYGNLMDVGDLTGWANLFAHGRYIMVTGTEDIVFDRDPVGLEAFFREHFFMEYEDGTPKTLHSSSNAVIDIEPGGERATCDSRMTVFQATEGFPLQVIATAIDKDIFEKVDGKWRFAERRAQGHLVGDMSRSFRV